MTQSTTKFSYFFSSRAVIKCYKCTYINQLTNISELEKSPIRDKQIFLG